MKKRLSLILAIVLSLSLLAGCGGGGGGSEEGGETSGGSSSESSSGSSSGSSEEGASVVVYQNKVEITEPFTAFANAYTAETGVPVEIKSSGGGTAYADALMAEFQTDRQPDIFVIEGMGGYNIYKDQLVPFDGTEEWVENTSLEFVVDGKIYGFPVAVEAWGMAYNKDLLDKAGIDPESLNSQEGYAEAFAKLDGMKDELGIDAVVSMAASTTTGMTWVTGLHNFNGYLSAGLPYGDDTVIKQVLAGEADMDRLAQYGDWVELLFQYADPEVLVTGDYDAQVGLWATGKSVFIHQGNWIDPWIDTNQGTLPFEVGYAPHASVDGEMEAIFIGAPSFYVLNANSENLEAAKEFLNYLAMNEKGHDYMVNGAKMVPAFTNVTLVPEAPLAAVVAEKVASGKAYSWWQNDLPAGFGMDVIGPIYEAFAKGDITKEQFVNAVAAEIQNIPNM